MAEGGAILEFINQGGGGAAPTEQELRLWVDTYELSSTTLGPGVDGRAADFFSDRESGYIVDLETMTVLWRERALFATPTIAALGVEKLSEYLE